MSFIRVLAACAALALAGATPAAAATPAGVEPVRIAPTIKPMRLAGAKHGSSLKPPVLPQIPGPVIASHVRRAADGTLETWCTQHHDHAAAHAAAAVTAQEPQR